MVSITHTKVAGTPANPNVTIDGPTWDATHTVTNLSAADVAGLAASATTDSTNASNITSGTLSAARLPTPTASTLGGVKSLAAVSHQFLTAIGTDGVPTQAQPAFTDISGSVSATQMPALSGDISSSAGSTTTTLATVNSNVGTYGSATTVPVLTVNGKGLVTAASTATVREVLTADRTYYVRTDGSDSNNGLANTSGGAFLTIAKALSVASAIDCSSYQLTISVQAGTYTAAVSLPRVLAGVTPILTGVGSTTIISTTSADAVTNDGGTPWQVNNMKLTTTTSGSCIVTKNLGAIKISGVEFGSCALYHIFASNGPVTFTGNYSITGNAQYHIISNAAAVQYPFGVVTVTLTGTPAFSGAFVSSNRVGEITAASITFSGSATGTRYFVGLNSVIDTGGGGANYFPGNVAGSTATGGQYA